MENNEKVKKSLFIFGLLASSLGFSQQELKLDIADAIVIRSLEFSYEKYITVENSFGVSALFNLADQETAFRYNENMMITPYFRHYFSTDDTVELLRRRFSRYKFWERQNSKWHH